MIGKIVAIIAVLLVAASPYLFCDTVVADQGSHQELAVSHVEKMATSNTRPSEPHRDALAIRVESVSPMTLNNGTSVPRWTYWIPSIGPIISGVLAFLGVYLGLRIATKNASETLQSAQKNNEAVLWQKANEVELRDIQIKLDEFYIPFQLKSNANLQFAQDLKSRQGKDYRLLLKLFDREWRDSLAAGDKKLIEIVSNNADELRRLIEDKSGLVDDALLPYLSRASAHFRILDLAYRCELGDDPGPFKSYVYPRELDGVLSLEIARLRMRIGRLRLNPSVCPPQQEALKIPSDLELKEWGNESGSMKI
ncbi:TPA: hypothetical protein QDB44_001718 [Burkholderia vietnamiensis]|nr:hypothetical protein [Burkholderia vietnamiensis]